MTKNSFAVEVIFKFLWKSFFLFLNLKLQLIPKFEVKENFPRFPSFRFCPIPKLENSEILESFLLLKFLVVYETQNLKTDWKMTQKKKRLTLWYGLRRPRFSSFRFCPILEIENLETSESFHLLQIFIVYITLSMGKVKTFYWISN